MRVDSHRIDTKLVDAETDAVDVETEEKAAARASR